MPATLVLPPHSTVLEELHRAAREQRCVFFAGLAGVGKSLLLQQLALVAHRLGRRVHVLQWDVARLEFESPEVMVRYPEVDGVTHAAIRKGVGLWVREAVTRWDASHPEFDHLLVGETPLIGNRFIELARVEDDPAEALLADARTEFLVPVPSKAVRQAIEQARAREMEHPLHEREASNAPPTVLRAQWGQVLEAGALLGIAPAEPAAAYTPSVYAEVYVRLLRRRHHRILPIEDVLRPLGSAYELDIAAGELRPTADEVARAMAAVESYPPGQLEAQVDGWFRV